MRFGEAKVKIIKQLPSCAALIVAVAIIGFATKGGTESWQTRLLEPDRFLMSLTFVGVAILLWSYQKTSNN